MGEGSDNYLKAAKQMAPATKQAGKTAKNAVNTTRATANAAASTVKAGAKVGKAVANVAKGTAAGGPWGAVAGAAWSLKNMLWKILVCVGIFLLILIITIVSLPVIIFSNLLGWTGAFNGNKNTLVQSFNRLSTSISSIVNRAYDSTLNTVLNVITLGGYNSALSLGNIINNAVGTITYDVCDILARYSVWAGPDLANESHFTQRIESFSSRMFSVSYQRRENQVLSFINLKPVLTIIPYLVSTISPFNQNVFMEAFSVDMNAKYENTSITNGEYIEYMSTALRNTLGDEIN